MTNATGQQVPEGWTMTSIGTIANLSKEKVKPPFKDSVRYLSLEHIESGTTKILGYDKASVAKSSKAVFHSGDILYGKLRPYLNKVCIPDFDGICSTDILVFESTEYLDNRYVMNYLRTPQVVAFANHNMTGTQLPRISYKKLSSYLIPLPPISEQKRIADKVEKLLGRINKIRAHLSSVHVGLKRFRQSVLSAACSGSLTEDWRNNHPNIESAEVLLEKIQAEKKVLINSGKLKKQQKVKDILNLRDQVLPLHWTYAKGFQIFFVTKLAGFEYTKYIQMKDSGDIPTIRAQNVRPFKIDKTNLKYIDKKTSELLERSALTKKALLVTFIGAGIGDIALFDEPNRWHLAPNVAKMESIAESLLDLRYINYYLMSAVGQREIFKHVKATAQPSLSMATIRDVDYILPPLEEQQEIVRRVKKLFALADKIEYCLAEVQQCVDKITKSILAKAFRGELVPTESELARQENRSYETAEKLLGRIRRKFASTTMSGCMCGRATYFLFPVRGKRYRYCST